MLRAHRARSRFRSVVNAHPRGARRFRLGAQRDEDVDHQRVDRGHRRRVGLDSVRLPSSAVLPEVTGLRGPLSCLTEARFGIVWGVTGAARTCLETAVSYATTRTQFGKAIAEFQLTQSKLAWMAVSLYQA